MIHSAELKFGVYTQSKKKVNTNYDGRGESSGFGVGLRTGGPRFVSRYCQRPTCAFGACGVRAHKFRGSESSVVGR